MKLTIPLKPLSVNEAHCGRHFKTKKFHQYERDVFYLLPENEKEVTPVEYFIKYTFYIKNYKMSDTGNFEKLITDLLVKRKYLRDDRYVKAFYLQKESVLDQSEERIEIEITPFDYNK